MTKRLWTIGYEGHSPESLTLKLRKAKVERVIDVRELPLSRKPGFSKRALQLGLAAAGIEYSHVKALGTPRAVRHAYKAGGDHAAFAKAYLAHLKGEKEAIAALEKVMEDERCALLCVEASVEVCHRGVLAELLAKRGWRATHL